MKEYQKHSSLKIFFLFLALAAIMFSKWNHLSNFGKGP